MQTLQIRLPKKILIQVDKFVSEGLFGSRSDFIKEATRKYVMENKFTGALPYIVGPYTEEQMRLLMNDPHEKLSLDSSEKAEIEKLMKTIEPRKDR